MKTSPDKLAFFTCLASSIGMLVGGFFVPPTGVIDGSVLSACGILLGFATLAVGAEALHRGNTAKIEKGDLSMTIGQTTQDPEQQQNDQNIPECK